MCCHLLDQNWTLFFAVRDNAMGSRNQQRHFPSDARTDSQEEEDFDVQHILVPISFDEDRDCNTCDQSCQALANAGAT